MSYCASIIIPVLNESECIEQSLIRLAPYREQGCEVIVVDGGSNDDSEHLAVPYADQVISSRSGRAIQMNAGAAQASSPWLLFLHIDTLLPEHPKPFINQLLAQSNSRWGFCRVKLSGARQVFRIIEWCMNQRSLLTAIPTGDQLVFFNKQFFDQHNGYADIPLMEDIEIAKRLRTHAKPRRLAVTVVTSSRRWEDNGTLKTILKMWLLRLLYWLRVSPATIASWY